MAFVGFAISLQLSIYRKGLTKSASRMGVGAQASDDAPSADIDMTEVMKHVRETIDDEFADVDALLATPGAGSSRAATPSRGPGQNAKRRKRALAEEIAYWEKLEAEHEQKAGLLVHEGCPAHEFQLVQSREAIPKLLQQTQSRLQAVLDEAQSLSLQRHSLQDKLDGLVAETSSQARGQDGHPEEGHEPPGGAREGPTVLEQLDRLQDELGRLEAGLAWVSVLERVVALSQRILSPESHHPSPLAALPVCRQLDSIVTDLQKTLPADMALLKVVVGVREQIWQGLKDIMSANLLKASEPLKWPTKTVYANVAPRERRAFETAYTELLYLQAEDEALRGTSARPTWSSGAGLYPLQALTQPIALRFKYHFQGTRNTNRNDKPEWAFANILDQVYEHQAFIEQYLQPLTERAGYLEVDVKSEFAMLLFPIILNLLRSRVPHLLAHPALLAHTIYQTIVFDDAIREGGFDIDSVSVNEGKSGCEWEGLAGVLLRDQGWFDQWLTGERKFAETQLHEIISADDAWTVTDESPDDESGEKADALKPTTSARQVRTLIEQITDRYAPLPSLEYRLPFLTTIQLPLLSTYNARISGSLDAFERLSSAFARAVPGALTGNTRTGAYLDQARVTHGTAGLERLMKAYLSGLYIETALRRWADSVFFTEMSSDLEDSPALQYRIQADGNLPKRLRMGGEDDSGSVFDALIGKYAALLERAEEMLVRHIAVEVENDLKQHLTRRWDQQSQDEHEPDSSLLTGITSLSSSLSSVASTLPPLPTSRIYRHTISHIVNHLSQRLVYAGWSKFTAVGGSDLLAEIEDWKSACAGALPGLLGGEQALGAPWAKLEGAASVLALPTGDGKDAQATFAQAMAAAWGGEAASRKDFLARMGASAVGHDELQGLLRRRVDCWR